MVETDLAPSAIQILIDDAEQEMVSRFGPELTQVETLEGNAEFIFPSRPVATVTSIEESDRNADFTLVASDYRIMNNGRQIQRRPDGVNGLWRWRPLVKITYVPVNDAARRKRVMIDLCRLAVQYNALANESAGDYSATSREYQQEREQILQTLETRCRMLA